MAASASQLTVADAELVSVRDAMRELGRLLDRLDAGEVEKLVLTQKSQMRAVLLTVERYAVLIADSRP